MANVLVDENSLSSIASAIREKNGTTITYKPVEMAPAIQAIEISNGGGEPIYADNNEVFIVNETSTIYGWNSLHNPAWENLTVDELANKIKLVIWPLGQDASNSTSKIRTVIYCKGIGLPIITPSNADNRVLLCQTSGVTPLYNASYGGLVLNLPKVDGSVQQTKKNGSSNPQRDSALRVRPGGYIDILMAKENDVVIADTPDNVIQPSPGYVQYFPIVVVWGD